MLILASWPSYVGCDEASQFFPDRFQIDRSNITVQETSPFLVRGRPVEPGSVAWDRYSNSIVKHQSLVSCLVRTEQEALRPNTLKVAWNEIRSKVEIEVCLFRIFTSLKDSKAIEEWLQYHGFRVIGKRRFLTKDPPALRGTDQSVYRIEGYWTERQYREKTNSLLFGLFGNPLNRGFSVAVFFDAHGSITGAGIDHMSGFN